MDPDGDDPARPAGDLDTLIARADLDALVRLVDAHCAARDWEALDGLRVAARAAVHTGRQLWPAATLAAYRLALKAPAAWAVRGLEGDAGRFVPGPLSEVIAQNHTWAELAQFLPEGPQAAFVAHERVLRGEAVDGSGLMDVLEIPFSLRSWEPAYALADYGDAGGRFDSPPTPNALLQPLTLDRSSPDVLDDADVDSALRSLVEPWLTQSNGRSDVVCVRGGVDRALAALGVRQARAAQIDARTAVSWLAWAGASGGAHGRRRGAASGRFGAWWLLVALRGQLASWPLQPDEVGTIAGDLQWWWWDAGDPPTGWNVQLAVTDVRRDVSWAFSAHDAS